MGERGGKSKKSGFEGDEGVRELLGEEGMRAFLDSEAYAEAEAAREMTTDMEAFSDSPEFAEGFKTFLAAALENVARENPEKFAAAARALAADAGAAAFAKRYQEEGVRITYVEAVELATGLVWMRTPYPREKGRERPADELPYVYDYEIRASKARKDASLLKELVERSRTEKLAWDTVQFLLNYLRDSGKNVPSELDEWVPDVAGGRRDRPNWGRDQTTQVRDELILDTVTALVECGMSKTASVHKKWSEPESACHAVAEALNIGYEAVVKAVDRERSRLEESP